MVFFAPEPPSKPTNHVLVMSRLSDSGDKDGTHGRRSALKHVFNVMKGSILNTHPGSNYVFLVL